MLRGLGRATVSAIIFTGQLGYAVCAIAMLNIANNVIRTRENSVFAIIF